jgi:aminoglycoside N3'-acetyltransferase
MDKWGCGACELTQVHIYEYVPFVNKKKNHTCATFIYNNDIRTKYQKKMHRSPFFIH